MHVLLASSSRIFIYYLKRERERDSYKSICKKEKEKERELEGECRRCTCRESLVVNIRLSAMFYYYFFNA